MTILVALHDPKDKCTWIGSDTIIYIGDSSQPCKSKWVIYDRWAMGTSGLTRVDNVIAARCDEIFGGCDDPFELTERLRKVLLDDGFQDTRRERESGPHNFGCNLILATPDGAWNMDGYFGFDAAQPGLLVAEGCGRELALGAAFAAREAGWSARAIVKIAVISAIEHHAFCGGEPWVYQLKAI